MKTVRIVALRKDRKRLLEHLQDSALIQIKKIDKARDGFEHVDMTSHMQVFERDVTLTEQALKILDGVSPEKGGMLSSFKGRREVDPDEIGVIASKSWTKSAATTKPNRRGSRPSSSRWRRGKRSTSRSTPAARAQRRSSWEPSRRNTPRSS